MHRLKQVKDELIEEIESYEGRIRGGHNEHDAMCIKVLASAADHICNIIKACEEEDEMDEEQRSGRRMARGRSYASGSMSRRSDPMERWDDGAMPERVERGRADRSGGDHTVVRELERLADKTESPEARRAIEKAIKMHQAGEY